MIGKDGARCEEHYSFKSVNESRLVVNESNRHLGTAERVTEVVSFPVTAMLIHRLHLSVYVKSELVLTEVPVLFCVFDVV